MSFPPIPNYAAALDVATVNAMADMFRTRVNHEVARQRGHDKRAAKKQADQLLNQSDLLARARKNQLTGPSASPPPLGEPGRIFPGPGPTDLPGPGSIIQTIGSTQTFIDDPTPPPPPPPVTGPPPVGPLLENPGGENAQWTERRGPTEPDPAVVAARRELLTHDAGRPLPGLAALGGSRAASARGVQRATLQAVHRPISRPAVGRSTFAGGVYYATDRPAPPAVQRKPRSMIDALLEFLR